MSLIRPQLRQLPYKSLIHSIARNTRNYATVDSATIVAAPPRPPLPPGPEPQASHSLANVDRHVLAALPRPGSATGDHPNLGELITQYVDRSGRVLDYSLPYEPAPAADRKIDFNSQDNGLVMIAHCVRDGEKHDIALCSGFAVQGPGHRKDETLVLTCAHTLEEIRWSPLLGLPPKHLPASKPSASRTSGTFVITGTSDPISPSTGLSPASAAMSSIRKSDLMLLSKSGPSMKTLPISPYPARQNTSIRAHFVVDKKPDESGWRPWVGGTWSKWVKGKVLGYRDFAGREAEPGTYDALSHLLFEPLPTGGSSGGPIVDEESGAVVGVVLGTRMDNSVEGIRGWGVPSETIFEMFSLPGLEGKR